VNGILNEMDHGMRAWDGAIRTALLNPTSRLSLTDKAMLNNLREDFMDAAFSAFKKRVTSITAPRLQGGEAEEVKYGLREATDASAPHADEAAKDFNVAVALRGLKEIQKVLEAKPAGSSMASGGGPVIPGLGLADGPASQHMVRIKSEHSNHTSVEDADAFLQELGDGLRATPNAETTPSQPPNGVMAPNMMLAGSYPPTPMFPGYAQNQPGTWFGNTTPYYTALPPGFHQPSATREGNGTLLAFPQREEGRLTPVTPSNTVPGTEKSHQARRREAHRQSQHRALSTTPHPSSGTHKQAALPAKPSRFDLVCPYDLLGKPCPRDERTHRRYPCDAQKVCKRGMNCNSQYCGDLHIVRTCKSFVHNGKCDVGPNCPYGHDRVQERRAVADRAKGHETGLAVGWTKR
jgi:hypothetical protein